MTAAHSADPDNRARIGLERIKSPEPPQVADSDLVVMAINRLQRAVVKMQAFEYDEQLNEHLTRAGEMLGWVAHNMLGRAEERRAFLEAAHQHSLSDERSD